MIHLALLLDLLHGEGFEHVANLHIVEAVEADTALVALSDFLGIVLEALERGVRRREDDLPAGDGL